MPTSSQALLLMHTGRNDLTLDKPEVVPKKTRIGSCSQRELTPCPVSHVDINELWKSSIVDNGEQLIVEDLTNLEDEKESSTVSSEFNIKGYKTILSYNKSSGSFAWKFNQSDQADSNDTREQETTVLPEPAKVRPKTGVGTDRTRNRTHEATSRPKTADVSGSRRQSVTFAKPLYYSCSNKGDKLVCFGLRVPGQKETEKTESKSILKSSFHPNQGSELNLETGGDGEIRIKMKGLKRNAVTTKSSGSNVSSKTDKAMISQMWKEQQQKDSVAKKCKNEKNENESYAVSFANRVHPSIYMRKDPPNAGSFDVCFSLRHNDAVSHDHLRNIIHQQTGVVPVQMRYEVLSIRVGDYGIRNRWIVKTGSQEDRDQLIESGLFIDNDNIVVMSLEEIMQREFRTYKFLTQTKAEHTAARIGCNIRNKIQMKTNKVK
ncbi:uncharacterized protein LOC132549707 [Ylistrum balloti]|uniref:uncharacterized protein LOC132549707 n=1 Tax=Ylistrum balloti TaxID=509963 RepID=UPI0029059D29|nr:uncharacterized protein LOC132549707 [Ylistrum balloti]